MITVPVSERDNYPDLVVMSYKTNGKGDFVKLAEPNEWLHQKVKPIIKNHLRNSDYRMLPDVFEEMSKEDQDELLDFRDKCRKIIRLESIQSQDEVKFPDRLK